MSLGAKWEGYVRWPSCRDCDGRGFVVRSRDAFPEECMRCKADREQAVKDAKAALTKARRTGR